MLVIPAGYPGGGLRSVELLARSLDRNRYTISVVCPDSPTTKRLARIEGLRCYAMEFPSVPTPRTVRQLASFIKAEQVDILHTHLFHGDLFGMLATRLVPVRLLVSTVHGINFFWEMERFPRKAVGWGAGWVYRVIYRAFDGMAAPSQAIKDAICSRSGIKANPGRVRVIHPGIDIAEIQQASVCAPRTAAWDAGSASTSRRIVTVANFDPFKGHRVLLEAVRRLTPEIPMQCALVGDGSDRRALEARAKMMGLASAVRFLGFRDDVPAILRTADLFVFPSLWEPLGIAVLEAMALGRPVIACAAGGIPEIITDGDSGILVSPGDPIALANGIKRLLADRGLAVSLGRRAREVIERRFDVRTMARAYEQWYEELLARKMFTQTVDETP